MKPGLPTFVAIFIVGTISAWIVDFLCRRRMGKALGRKVKNSELTSISTWMKVDEAEKLNRPEGVEQLRPSIGMTLQDHEHTAASLIEEVIEGAADKIEDISAHLH